MKNDFLAELDDRAIALARMYIPDLKNGKYYRGMLDDLMVNYLAITSRLDQAIVDIEKNDDVDYGALVIYDSINRLVVKICALVHIIECLVPEATLETSQDAGSPNISHGGN